MIEDPTFGASIRAVALAARVFVTEEPPSEGTVRGLPSSPMKLRVNVRGEAVVFVK